MERISSFPTPQEQVKNRIVAPSYDILMFSKRGIAEVTELRDKREKYRESLRSLVSPGAVAIYRELPPPDPTGTIMGRLESLDIKTPLNYRSDGPKSTFVTKPARQLSHLIEASEATVIGSFVPLYELKKAVKRNRSLQESRQPVLLTPGEEQLIAAAAD